MSGFDFETSTPLFVHFDHVGLIPSICCGYGVLAIDRVDERSIDVGFDKANFVLIMNRVVYSCAMSELVEFGEVVIGGHFLLLKMLEHYGRMLLVIMVCNQVVISVTKASQVGIAKLASSIHSA